MNEFTVPDSVHAAEDSNGDLVLLNQATGRWHKLNRTGTDVFLALRSDVGLDEAVEALIHRHPDIPAERIRQDVDRLVGTLVERGLLVLADDFKRSAAAVLMTPAKPGRPITAGQWVITMAGFVLAVVLLRLPFRIVTTSVIRLRRLLLRRNASVDEARSILAAAHRVSTYYPGRVACLELSLTAVLAGALSGLGIDWCLGTAVDPQTFHAWIEVEGEPVTDPSDDPIPPTYRKVLTV
ncbi:hypothetical protein JOF56_003393 [Kibdelosporangium banguiense]|uniref:Microcin J25-processing protein McjB C-terminal domain-containing protein n=1 Tax=Kibdelosporangium banguiense TaxID=1365924 RepID=A0ABS4TF25_9PSEU|nr:lasso peptide biosynthesis B2 protein [Kibdelosporangium banguiense]MBP2323008.1 hypothetical protein [Kibdelosporangium banguiense]